MQKILVISYYFPPCNLTGANRVGQWYEHLSKTGIYPIILTRKWEKKVSSFDDVFAPTSLEKEVIEKPKGQIRYLPFKGTLKDKMNDFLGLNRVNLMRRFLSLIGLFFQSISLKLSPYFFLYKEAKEILKEDSLIDIVIISGMPFQQFIIGYKLKKKFPRIMWIPDYRDEWTSRPNHEKSIALKVLNGIDRFFEKKWTSNAHSFIYVDEYYLERIENVIMKKGIVVKNGYRKRGKINRVLDKNNISLTFSGTLYSHQDLSVISEGAKMFSHIHPEIGLTLYFLGSKLNKNIQDYILKNFSGQEEMIVITERLTEDELEMYYSKTDAFLMFPINNMPGVIPTKVLNYLPLEIPIIFCPSDEGRISKLIAETETGFNIKTASQFVETLEILHTKKNEKFTFNKEIIEKYSVDHQVLILANSLKKFIK